MNRSVLFGIFVAAASAAAQSPDADLVHRYVEQDRWAAQALRHLEKAIALDPRDDAAYVQLWQAHRALGQVEPARKAHAEFQRLRARKREAERLGLLRKQGVTEQEVEESAARQP